MDGIQVRAHVPLASRAFFVWMALMPPTKSVGRLVFHLHRPFTMSDDNDFHIEQTDAGASATIPMEAGQIKKGG